MKSPHLWWQFWPPNPYSSSAFRYTGKLKLKIGVQVRQLCHTHVDLWYVNMILQYLKKFCVAVCSFVTYGSVNDKAIIPVGEPGLPVSTGVRGSIHSAS